MQDHITKLKNENQLHEVALQTARSETRDAHRDLEAAQARITELESQLSEVFADVTSLGSKLMMWQRGSGTTQLSQAPQLPMVWQ
jgi:predicted  nucleic acid-binding Zn-ribbon protein